MTKLLISLLFLSIFNICSYAQDETVLLEEVKVESPNKQKSEFELFDKFVKYITGTYSSAAQHEVDTTYFDISLVMAPIGKGKTEQWFYVEQAMASKLDKPYRQRLYRVYQPDKKTIISEIYTLKKPEDFVGIFKNKNKLNNIKFENIDHKQGCDVLLTYDNDKDVFSGGTQGKECQSVLKGAKYATTEVTLVNGKLISWDRGYDESSSQIWGAEKGGYIFIKKSEE